MKYKNKIKFRILGLIAIVLLCIANTTKGLQNDTFYMIKLGKDILSNGIDLMDHYCWITELPYTYPHWLYDIFIFNIYDNFSYIGVYISTIILFIVLILTIYKIHLKINKNEFLVLFISIISIACLCRFATARSQLITVILYLLLVYFIEELINTGKKKYIVFLTLISLIIANVHATIWVFTFILYLPYIASHIVYKICNSKCFKKVKISSKKIIIEKINNIKLLLTSFILSLFMGLLSPIKICYTYIFRVMLGNSQDYIIEHSPLVIIKEPIFIIFSVILVVVLVFSDTKIYLKELFMICGITLMCLTSIRHLIFFYTIVLLYISIICMRYLNNKSDKTLDILTNLITNKNIIYIGTLIMITLISGYKFYINSKETYVSKSDFPKEAVEFIKTNLDVNNINLFNGYNYGSYLLFNDIPVFIDSRCDLYLKEFNGLGYSIFDDAVNIYKNYEKKFEFYNVSHILIKKEELLYYILEKDSNYNLMYKDKYFALFERIDYEEV